MIALLYGVGVVLAFGAGLVLGGVIEAKCWIAKLTQRGYSRRQVEQIAREAWPA